MPMYIIWPFRVPKQPIHGHRTQSTISGMGRVGPRANVRKFAVPSRNVRRVKPETSSVEVWGVGALVSSRGWAMGRMGIVLTKGTASQWMGSGVGIMNRLNCCPITSNHERAQDPRIFFSQKSFYSYSTRGVYSPTLLCCL